MLFIYTIQQHFAEIPLLQSFLLLCLFHATGCKVRREKKSIQIAFSPRQQLSSKCFPLSPGKELHVLWWDVLAVTTLIVCSMFCHGHLFVFV